MKFRTELKAVRPDFELDPRHPVVLLGSCFSDNISEKMNSCLWRAVNPLGTLYNPLSIADSLMMSLKEDEEAFRSTLFKEGNYVHSWAFDSSFSGRTEGDCLKIFKERSEVLNEHLEKAEAIIITFGSSRVFEKGKDGIVANCHKQPSAFFTQKTLEISEISDCWKDTIESLNSAYPELRFIFTVSPVRHTRDGAVENTRSKARLVLAVEDICAQNSRACYFPAYELMNDDLRDYRFYSSDLVHPSAEGIEYIWEFFCSTFIGHAGFLRLKEGEKLLKELRHRPLLPVSESERRNREDRIQEQIRNFCSDGF